MSQIRASMWVLLFVLASTGLCQPQDASRKGTLLIFLGPWNLTTPRTEPLSTSPATPTGNQTEGQNDTTSWQGAYHVLLPDGRLLRVDYSAVPLAPSTKDPQGDGRLPEDVQLKGVYYVKFPPATGNNPPSKAPQKGASSDLETLQVVFVPELTTVESYPASFTATFRVQQLAAPTQPNSNRGN